MFRNVTRVEAISLLVVLLCGCFRAGYVVQAAQGQLQLYAERRPIEEVLADPDTDERTRILLAEARRVVQFAEDQGLASQGNYEHYVELDRNAVVWFLAASRPLAFEPKTWVFPVVGGFPYLGWFDPGEARRFRRHLEGEGWDVMIRPVRAYSTGGWFTDAVLSSMLSPHQDALRFLANIVLHELVHANVLVEDQAIFNESVATFVGDRMTGDYLAARFGPGSAELEAFRVELAESERRSGRMARAYRELAGVYDSERPRAAKLAAKRRILERLQADVPRLDRPNNAVLIGYKTYNAGQPELAELFEDCDRSWPRFLAAVKSIGPAAFDEAQEQEIGPIIRRASCRDPAAGPAPRGRVEKLLRGSARHSVGSWNRSKPGSDRPRWSWSGCGVRRRPARS